MATKNTGRRVWLMAVIFLWIFWLSGSFHVQAAVVQKDNGIESIELMDYVETIYDSGNGMATSEANTILQDSRGYIWVGSYGGLLRYCGHQFENISTQRKGAPESGIRVLFEDGSERIWIGTNDAGVYLYEKETFSKMASSDSKLEAQVSCLSVRSIAEMRDGQIFVGTTTGLYRVNEELELQRIEDERLQGETIESLICGKHDNLWGITESNKWFVLRNEELEILSGEELFGVELSKVLMQTENGDFYFGTDDSGVVRLSMDGQAEILSIGERGSVNDIYQDSNGQVWVCSDGGVGYFSENDTFYKVQGLSLNSTMDQIVEDYEGNLWIASSRAGVFQLSRSKFKNVGYAAGVDQQTVNASVLYHNALYIGTDNGLSIMNADGERVQNELTRALNGTRIRSFMRDSKENLWISTYREKGLICYNDEKEDWISINSEKGMPTEKVRMSLELQNGSIAAATNSGVAIIRDGRVHKVYAKDEGVANDVILCLTQLSDGTLLAGSDGNGIYEINLETDEVTNITTEMGLMSGVILCMVPDKAAEGYWISNGNELSLMTKDGIRTVDSVKEVAGGIFDVKMDGEYIWLLKSSGIVKINRESLLKGKPEYEIMTRKDGLTSSITANSSNYISKDGMLFLCTGNGIFFIDTKEIYKNTAAPRVEIGTISTDTLTVYGAEDIVLPANNQKVTITMELLSFGLGDGSLEYYLEGFDEKPIRSKNQSDSSVNYTNLPGGTYTFHLKGYNSDGTASEALSIKIRKEAGIFERQYMYVLGGGGILVLVLILVVIVQFIHKKQMLRRQMEYKNLTEQAIKMISRTIDAKDKYTIGHSNRVAAYSVEIGKRSGLSEEQLEQLHYSALLHDIGKIGIPDHILNKKGKLTDEEFAKIKEHPAIGGKILKDFTLAPWIAAGAEFHHERYDGRGYNKGLKEETIPLYARIISVADAFDSMNSTRIYRSSMTEEVICRELEKGRGTQFDEKFADIMLQMIKEKFTVE